MMQDAPDENQKPKTVAMPQPELPKNSERLRSYSALTEDGKARCLICGGTEFGPGPSQRKSSTGKWPHCTGCQSLERHRLLRKIWLRIPADVLERGRTLQFSPDLSILPEWFSEFEVSIYGGKNSIDMENIHRPDNRYDFIICNHVLEHIPDDRKAFRELIRVLAPAGILQIMVPSPFTLPKTNDWGYPRSDQHEHFRMYGADVIERFQEAAPEAHLHCVTSKDDVTGVEDYVYLWAKQVTVLEKIKQWMEPAEPSSPEG